MSDTFAGDANWQPVNIGAGGWLTGIDVAPDGTMVVRTDTYGAYIWNGSGWDQLATASSMPSSVEYSASVYELRVSASNSNILYMEMGDGIYKSVDRGASWTKTAFPVTTDAANLDHRMDGQKMAIDPTNPNIVFAGTQAQGLWVTRDGGATWQQITAVPQGTQTGDTGLTGICISGSKVFVGTAGSGVYASSDGGVTWKSVGGPADIANAVVAPDGTYYAAGRTDGALWKYSNGTWTKVVDSLVHSVAIDPFDPSHIVVTTEGGSIQESKDGGQTWSGWNYNNQLESSNDVPWLEKSGGYMSSGGLVFDPLHQGHIWQSAGVGVWETTVPSDLQWNTPVVWNSHSMGIEQLVSNEVLAPVGVDPIFASWDRPFFSMSDLNAYPTDYGAGGGNGASTGSGFSAGWSLDYASTQSNFIVGISDWWGVENSGFSTDGGKTWQKFAGLPTWAMSTVGGSIAASTPLNFIWAAAGNQPPAYTLDGGKTWTNISLPGVTDYSLVQYQYYLDRTSITADRVLANTFYLVDSGSGVYRTTDGGVSWTKVFTGQISPWSYWNAKIEAVPGSAGEIFFTSGPQGSDLTKTPGLIDFMHSKDGGATWQTVTGVQVTTFGYGAAATPGGPATIVMVGSVNGHYGIWYSADDAQTWTQIGEHPMGSLDNIKTISGDMDQYGMVYLGFGGSGYAYVDFAHSGSTPSPTTGPTELGTIVAALDDVGTPATVKSGATINDSTPTLSGTVSSALASGETLVVYRDGKQIGHVDPTSNSWSFTDPGAADGNHVYTVRVEDSAGHAGAYSASFSLNIDTVAPNQVVSVTSASTAPNKASTFSFSAKHVDALATTSTSAVSLSGTISSALATGESLVVYRDGVAIGYGTVSNGTWTFSDNVTGTHDYTAQVQDAAGNLGQMSNVYVTASPPTSIYGSIRSDTIKGTAGDDFLSGVPATGSKIGKGTIDVLTGNGGNDTFVLGDSRGRFYDDGNARSAGMGDYARITDFNAGDHLQLKGAASDYLQVATTVSGASGTGIYYDTNHNGILDKYDEFIALVQNHSPLTNSDFIFV